MPKTGLNMPDHLSGWLSPIRHFTLISGSLNSQNSKPAIIKDNYYAVYKDSSWKMDNTEDLMSDTLTAFKGYKKK